MRHLFISRKPSYKALYVNWILVVCIVIINGFILWGLIGPKVAFELKSVTTDPPRVESMAAATKENRLVIPSIYLDTKINEGSTYEALDDGAWRRPATSTPELGGNTVLAGHRFTYQGKSIFYNLDKVKVGDEIGATYNGTLYKYKVRETKIVEPSNLTVESSSEENILTLYTCTPLWSTEKRLVVIAGLEETVR